MVNARELKIGDKVQPVNNPDFYQHCNGGVLEVTMIREFKTGFRIQAGTAGKHGSKWSFSPNELIRVDV